LNILTIDTATDVELVSILSPKGVSNKTRAVASSHSKTLFANIDAALKELNLTISDISLIGVGIGPGSFTGIRIAVATTRMLAQLIDIPLVGIKTHLLYAASVETKAHDRILIAFDAKKDRLFGALYKKGVDPLLPDEIIPPGDYKIDFLTRGIERERKTYLIGNGVEKYHNEFSKKIPNHSIISNFLPSGEIACQLTKEIYLRRPDKFNDYNQIVPYYARKSDAEIMRRDKE
jgi:tRNA threonylcarbamoyladenosine biosynthesis protein TsaB